jgi:hypothetical protein
VPCPCKDSHVVRLYYQGWAKVSIMRVLQVSRPTVNAWIRRFEAEDFAGLVDKPRGPKHPRKVWLPLIVQVYHLQKAHPDAGEFRIWSLLAQPDISVCTVGRLMALNRRASVLGAPYRRYGGVHSILVIAWHLLSTHASYQELGSDHFDRCDAKAYRLKLIRKLEALGLKVVVEPALSVSEAPSFSSEWSVSTGTYYCLERKGLKFRFLAEAEFAPFPQEPSESLLAPPQWPH